MESEKRSFLDKLSKIGREILEIKNKKEVIDNVIFTSSDFISFNLKNFPGLDI